MAQKELVFKLKFVDENGAIVEKTAQSIQDINKSIKDLKNELDNTELGSEAWNDLASDLGKAENAMEKVGETTKKAKEGQKSFGDSMSSLPGPIGGVIKGAQAMNAALMKLVLNPIGAVIAAVVLGLTALYKAFTSTKAGGEAMEQVMAGISAVIDVLRDRVLKVGSAIVKFFSGDFSGALEDAKGAVSGFGAEIAAEFQEAARLKKELQSIEDATRELTKERALQNAEIAKAKLVINDETKSYEERQAALEQVRQAEIALSKQEEILASRRYEAIKAQNALSDSSKEALDEEAAAYVALQNAQQMSLQKQKAVFDQQKALRDRQRNEQKAAFEKRKGELEKLNEIEGQLIADNIKNLTEASIREVQIQKVKQIELLDSLKASREQRQKILLLIEKDTERKLTDIQKDAQQKRNDAFKISSQTLSDSELAASERRQAVIQGAIENNENNLNNYFEDAANGRLEFNQENYDSLVMIAENGYMLLLDEQKKYEEQLLSQEQKRYADTKELRQTNLDENKQLARDEFDTQNALLKEQLDNDTITKTEYNEQQIELQNEFRQSIKTLNDEFDQQQKLDTEENTANVLSIRAEADKKEIDAKRAKNDVLNALNKEQAEADKASAQLAIDAAGLLSELAGENAELSKAFAIIQTTISTYQAAQAAYASQLAIPTPDAPARAAIAAGIAIATGLARVVAIQNTDTSGVNAADGMLMGQGSGRMDNMSVNVSNGESIINARSTQRFKPLLSAINMAGGGKSFSGGFSQTQTSPETTLLNSLMGQKSSPMKTYVVSTEVSSSVSLDRQIKSRSIL